MKTEFSDLAMPRRILYYVNIVLLCCIFAPMKLEIIASHCRETLKIGVPIVVGQLGVIILGFADTMMVGHYSTPSLAAASFVNNIFTLVTIMLMGFSYGITPLVGAIFSRKEYAKAGALMRPAFVANACFGLLLVAIMTVIYFFLDRFGQPESLMPLIRPYYIVILCSMLPVVVFNVCRQFTDGITLTSVAMWILLGGNVFNIVFNYLLIYGKAGFPELGLLGAGISTLASRVLMAVVAVWLLFRKRRFAVYREGFRNARVKAADVCRHVKMSFPISLQMGMETGTFTFSAIMVGWIGELQMASYQVMVTMSTLGYMFYYGIGSAVAIRVASFTGLGDNTGVKRAAFAGHAILLLLAVCASSAFFFLSDTLVSFFTDDAAVAAICLTLIAPLILYQFCDATQVCYANALRGTSHVMPMMWIAFVSYVLVGIPVAYLLGFPAGFGEKGIFYSFSISLFTAAVLFLWQFLKVAWKNQSQNE